MDYISSRTNNAWHTQCNNLLYQRFRLKPQQAMMIKTLKLKFPWPIISRIMRNGNGSG